VLTGARGRQFTPPTGEKKFKQESSSVLTKKEKEGRWIKAKRKKKIDTKTRAKSGPVVKIKRGRGPRGKDIG